MQVEFLRGKGKDAPVEIMIQADPQNIVQRAATDEDKMTYKGAWEAFEAAEAEAAEAEAAEAEAAEAEAAQKKKGKK